MHALEQFTDSRHQLEQLLNWWVSNMKDHQHGGFKGRITGEGQSIPDAEKGLVLNARILWTFSAAARQFPRMPAWWDMAHRAYHYLLDHFWDTEQHGFYWSVDHQGRPLHTKKQVYGQAFVLYGLSEYYLLTENPKALDYARQTFDLLEKYSLDTEKNGYFEAFSKDWVLLEDLRLSDKDDNEAKTQNTHLHLLEGYTTLLKALQQEGADTSAVHAALRNLVLLFKDRFIDPKTGHIQLFFDEDWNPKSDIVSFGHDIEAAWLLWEAVQALDEVDLQMAFLPICIKIAQVTLTEAVMPDGSIINQRWDNTGQRDTDRIWWVQSEAIVGFLNAWEMSHQTAFLKASVQCWAYTQQHMIDHTLGEWYWSVSAEGQPNRTDDKAGFWKCPYHNGRMLLRLCK